MAMFYFVKRLSALRIVTEPCSDHIPLFGCFPVLLHHVFYVGGFGGGKDGLVLLRTEMDNRIYGSPEYFVGLVDAKNGADCYSKNGDAVTVLTWQS